MKARILDSRNKSKISEKFFARKIHNIGRWSNMIRTNYGSRLHAIKPQDFSRHTLAETQLKNEESLFGEMAIFFARMLSE